MEISWKWIMHAYLIQMDTCKSRMYTCKSHENGYMESHENVYMPIS